MSTVSVGQDHDLRDTRQNMSPDISLKKKCPAFKSFTEFSLQTSSYVLPCTFNELAARVVFSA